MAAPDVSSRSLQDLYSLADRVAIVTGGARGIGAAIASRLAEAGAAVAVADINIELAQQTAEKLAAGGARVVAVAIDVTDPASVNTAVATVRSELGEIAILINNAGLLGDSAPLTELDDELFDQVMRVNVKGPINCSRAVAPFMIGAGSGVIVNIASTASYRVPNPGTRQSREVGL